MEPIWITGAGFISSIGNDKSTVLTNLKELRHGIECPGFLKTDSSPVKVAGTLKGFDVESSDPEDWLYPEQYRVPRATPSKLLPSCPLCMVRLQQAIQDAALRTDDLKDPEVWTLHCLGWINAIHTQTFEKMDQRGVMACNPLAIVASIAGTSLLILLPPSAYEGLQPASFSLRILGACPRNGLDEIQIGQAKAYACGGGRGL